MFQDWMDLSLKRSAVKAITNLRGNKIKADATIRRTGLDLALVMWIVHCHDNKIILDECSTIDEIDHVRNR